MRIEQVERHDGREPNMTLTVWTRDYPEYRNAVDCLAQGIEHWLKEEDQYYLLGWANAAQELTADDTAREATAWAQAIIYAAQEAADEPAHSWAKAWRLGFMDACLAALGGLDS